MDRSDGHDRRDDLRASGDAPQGQLLTGWARRRVRWPPGAQPRPAAGSSTTTGDQSTTSTTAADTQSTTTTTSEAPRRGPAPDGMGGGIGSASADVPEALPWLIRLDDFVDGQEHQGNDDIVVRSNNWETSLNEAVALDLLEEAGLASQHAAATSFSVNGGEPVLRLAIEHPDDAPGRPRTSRATARCTRPRAPAIGPTGATTPRPTTRSSTRRAATTSPTSRR